jgi:hypothetical protein
MKKNYLLFGLFCFSFILGCETDESITEKKEEVILNQYPQIETVSYQEFTKSFDDINNKMDLYKSIEGKSLKSSEGDFIIKTDDIKRIKQGEYISYTMVLEKRNPKNSTIYNLTIENKAGIPGMFITAYKPSPQWLADKTKTFDGEINTYRTDVITHIPENEEPPESGDGGTSGGGGGQGDGTAYPYDCEGEVVTSRVAVPFTCGCGDWPWDNCQGCETAYPTRPGYEYKDVYECYNSSSGGEHGGSTDQPSGGSGGDSTNDPNPELHSLTILMDDGSRVTTAEYLTNMWSLNYLESQELSENVTFSDRLYFFMANNQFSREAMAFGSEAFDAFMNGGEVDFTDPLDNYNFTEESTEILAFEQDYRNQMKNAEKAIFDNLSRFQQLDYLHSAFLAREYSQIYFENTIKVQYNGKGDAYRHALWNALGAAKLGPTLMEQLTNAHEVPDIGEPANPLLEKEMDLHNNNIGRNIGNHSSFMLMMKVKITVDNGETKYLKPTNQDGTIVPGVTVLKNTNE